MANQLKYWNIAIYFIEMYRKWSVSLKYVSQCFAISKSLMNGCNESFRKLIRMHLTYLPILVSSSSSDGARLFRRHNVAIIPICSVKQHTKSMISKSKSTAPTATAMRDADVTGFAGITRSRPKKEHVDQKRAPYIHFDRVCFFHFRLPLRMVCICVCK